MEKLQQIHEELGFGGNEQLNGKWVLEMREDIATGLVVAEDEVAGAGSDAVGVVWFWMLQGRSEDFHFGTTMQYDMSTKAKACLSFGFEQGAYPRRVHQEINDQKFVLL
ncbi:hypothetical protein C5167_009011 [Papaver somniferum]|uniref:Uncharacterized protein n=1 Tax=Papaver somniferum TaxID=3469 RepID=A0A4Y7K052_PAPSO|nr:hypothetical protein C5167_009011 [Papaver somniferum]